MSTSTFAGLAGLLVALFIWLRKSKASTASLPPGPKPLPLVGNIKDLTSKELWLPATRWAKQYGDVVYLHIFGQGLVFLSSPEAASDLMDKRGAIYSDKPPLVMAGELCNCKNMVAFTRYGDQSKRQRKILHKALGAPAISTYYPLIMTATSAFLRRLIADPLNYMKITRRYSGGLTLLVIYGYEAVSENDEFLEQGEDSLDLLANEVASGGGIWPVDVFPFLQHLPHFLPGMSFKRKAAKWRAQLEEFVDKPYEYVKNAMKSGDYKSSFMSTMLEDQAGNVRPEFEFDLKWTGNSMYGGSLDTMTTAISHFLLEIMAHPEVLEKAQKEIDTAVGSDRLPTFEDRPRLPYVEAVLQELWRWSVSVPLDDVYRGMHIPKGSLIFTNLWAITRNENLYPDPFKFDPGRFMGSHEEVLKRRKNIRVNVFGFGRRQCPGLHLADSSIWLLIACMMATLSIKKPVDENGKVIEPVHTFDNSIFRTPTPFKCDIRPRSEKALILIKQSEVI
ncbi:hypothetical protein AX14_007483 [Amanita brunnescens Koide BX004]|nr:hypothetical protein AX14_007483 [Amanita brunnescens Koide BX004]